MSGDKRNISGSVHVTQAQDVAATAAAMASQLWWEEFKSQPKASDGKYLDLVKLCAGALKGSDIYGQDYTSAIKKVFG